MILLPRSENKLIKTVKNFENLKESKSLNSQVSYIAVDIKDKKADYINGINIPVDRERTGTL